MQEGDLKAIAKHIKTSRAGGGGSNGAVDINYADSGLDGWTALHLAAMCGKVFV